MKFNLKAALRALIDEPVRDPSYAPALAPAPVRGISDGLVDESPLITASTPGNMTVGSSGLGGYVAARHDRTATAGWNPGAGSARSDILPDLPDLRSRSRDLARNNPLASGAIRLKNTSVVGAGLQLQSRIDRRALGLDDDAADEWQRQVEREFALWSGPECDVARQLGFASIQEVAFRSRLESGDCFVVQTYLARPPSPYRLRLQLIEGDRVTNPNWNLDTATLQGGVETDLSGAPLAYHILRQHPGDFFIPGQPGWIWDRVPVFDAAGRRQVHHLYRTLRPAQRRGVPDLAPVIEHLRQLGKYTETELRAAVTAAYFALAVTTPTGEPLASIACEKCHAPNNPSSYSCDQCHAALRPGSVNADKFGSVLNLLPGEQVQSIAPGRPNVTFDVFILSILRQIGMGLGIPYEVLIQHFTASYSAARAALAQAWQYFDTERAWLVAYLCQPVYEAFLTEAVALGRIKAQGFTDEALRAAWCGATWIGPPRPSIQPLAEYEAAGYAEDRGWTTAADNAARLGSDFGDNITQRAREQREREAAGLVLTPGVPGTEVPAPTTSPRPVPADKQDAA